MRHHLQAPDAFIMQSNRFRSLVGGYSECAPMHAASRNIFGSVAACEAVEAWCGGRMYNVPSSDTPTQLTRASWATRHPARLPLSVSQTLQLQSSYPANSSPAQCRSSAMSAKRSTACRGLGMPNTRLHTRNPQHCLLQYTSHTLMHADRGSITRTARFSGEEQYHVVCSLQTRTATGREGHRSHARFD